MPPPIQAVLHARALRYGTAEFTQLTEFVRRFYGPLDRQERRWAQLLMDPVGAVRAMARVARLPIIEVSFTSSPAGQALQQFYGRRRFLLPTGRMAQAVLRIPPTREAYLAGHSRQAVRTNARRALASGVTCRDWAPDAWSQEAGAMPCTVLPPGTLDGHDPGSLLLSSARSPDGKALAVAAVLHDAHVAWLLTMATVSRDPIPQAAKHLLHVHVTDRLRERGVAALWAGDALYVEPNVQYVQHLFGFSTVNLRRRPAVSGVEQRSPAFT